MTGASRNLDALPEFAILTKSEVSSISGLSTDTLDRMHNRGVGPRRKRLSERRVGYTVGEVRTWLKQQTDDAKQDDAA